MANVLRRFHPAVLSGTNFAALLVEVALAKWGEKLFMSMPALINMSFVQRLWLSFDIAPLGFFQLTNSFVSSRLASSVRLRRFFQVCHDTQHPIRRISQNGQFA